MRPIAVSTKLAASNSSTSGQVAEVARLERDALRAHRHPGVAGVVAAEAHAELERLDVGAVGGRLPHDEAERHEQVGGVAVEGVRPAGALADVPGVHRVVDELGHRVEERRQRAHVLVRHEEAAPLLGVEALDEGEHLGPVLLEPSQQLVLRGAAERLRALVDVAVHVPHAERIRRGAAGPRDVDAREVALGGVDEVPDDVAHLPVARRPSVPPTPSGADASASIWSDCSRTVRSRLSLLAKSLNSHSLMRPPSTARVARSVRPTATPCSGGPARSGGARRGA